MRLGHDAGVSWQMRQWRKWMANDVTHTNRICLAAATVHYRCNISATMTSLLALPARYTICYFYGRTTNRARWTGACFSTYWIFVLHNVTSGQLILYHFPEDKLSITLLYSWSSVVSLILMLFDCTEVLCLKLSVCLQCLSFFHQKPKPPMFMNTGGFWKLAQTFAYIA